MTEPLLYELAITPDVFVEALLEGNPETAHQLRELLNDLAHCGMVANLNKDEWFAHVKNLLTCNKTSPQLRSDILSCLSLLEERHRLVSDPIQSHSPLASDEHWLQQARATKRSWVYDWIVTTENLRKSNTEKTRDIVGIRQVRDPARWAPHRSIRVRTCRSSYSEALRPLLRHAMWIDLVDPYLWYREEEDRDPRDDRHFAIVRICARRLRRPFGLPSQPEIRVHTKDRAHAKEKRGKESVEEALAGWENRLKELNRELDVPRWFKVMLWREKTNGPRFHDRFLLSNQCGVSVPYGFDCLSDQTGHRTVWTLLPEAIRSDVYRDYTDGTSPFELTGHCSVSFDGSASRVIPAH
jgi:hypothetical protein